MKKGQSPRSTANYKGRKKGAKSAAWHEFMPLIRTMTLDHLTAAEISAQTKVPFSTVAMWIHDDEELKSHYENLSSTMMNIVKAEAFKGMANSIPRLASMAKGQNPSTALRASNQLNVIFESVSRHQREDAALEGLETRLAAIQEAQVELGHSSLPALQPVDVEVHSSDTAESLPMVIDGDDPAD